MAMCFSFSARFIIIVVVVDVRVAIIAMEPRTHSLVVVVFHSLHFMTFICSGNMFFSRCS